MKHSAWVHYRSTDPNKPKPVRPREFSLPAFKATTKTIEKWLGEICVLCGDEFTDGDVVVELTSALAHGRCI